MFSTYLMKLIFFGAILAGISAFPALAQEANNAPLTQGDIDGFLSVYGSENPPEAASAGSAMNAERLGVVARRLSSVYVMMGQNDDEEAMLKRLAAIGAPNSVSQGDYALYRANNESLKPVFTKFLGSYTLRLPNSVAELVTKSASNDAAEQGQGLEVPLEAPPAGEPASGPEAGTEKQTASQSGLDLGAGDTVLN